jgi:3-hydroxybutyryl-CoA dehydrogenase
MAFFERVAVIGAGTMGNGIAQTFATHGSAVALIDIDAKGLDKGVAAIRASLDKFAAKGVLPKPDADAAFARVSPSGSFDGVKGAQLVVEAVVEREDVKRKVFGQLDALTAPECILATNTSSISITAIGASTRRADKVIGMHFMNPVPLMKLVEVIRGQETSAETTATVLACSEALGKVPVEASDYPGFVSNRVLMPMINEAVYCLMEGVAERDAIDSVMKLGMAHPMGPLTLADFIGLDICLDIMNVLYEGFGDSKYRPCPLLKRMVDAGYLGRKSGRGFYEYEQK